MLMWNICGVCVCYSVLCDFVCVIVLLLVGMCLSVLVIGSVMMLLIGLFFSVVMSVWINFGVMFGCVVLCISIQLWLVVLNLVSFSNLFSIDVCCELLLQWCIVKCRLVKWWVLKWELLGVSMMSVCVNLLYVLNVVSVQCSSVWLVSVWYCFGMVELEWLFVLVQGIRVKSWGVMKGNVGKVKLRSGFYNRFFVLIGVLCCVCVCYFCCFYVR